ncbi:unnamed protein product [Candida verbasci]|uniref:Major facilitator superfamily (MFS) profile domain-containing protein n=1 Tax=Candida verbasci TaxID=1227364 RepID=A0A9W4TZM1_9ASCO|nr:unnamed protein product [Candida verbasci]
MSYNEETIHEIRSRGSYSLSRSKTNQSELSKIISGIKDDQQLDEENKNYVGTGESEFILAEELNKFTSRGNISKQQSQVDLEQSSVEEKVIDDDKNLDKGFAWVIAICSMLAMISTWGANSSYGVLLSYFMNENVFPEATKYDYALVGSIVVFLANFLSPISTIAYKIFGFKAVAFFGLCFQCLGWFGASGATKIWQLYLSEGVAVGISFSFIFIPATLVLPTWFHRRKAASFGICISGAGLGGLIFSLAINKVIEEDTHNQAMRMVGYVTLFCVLIVILVMNPRNYNPPPLKERLSRTFIMESCKAIFDTSVLKNWGIIIIAIWFSIALMGYTLMIFSLSAYGSSIGLNHSQSTNLIAALSAAQVVGRIGMGFTADFMGRCNATSMFCLINFILLFAYWINARTYGSVLGFAVLIGLVIGIGSTMAQPLAADALQEKFYQLPSAWAWINVTVSFFCLVAECIALALVRSNSNRPYLHTQIFAGCCFFASFILMLLLREFLVRKLLQKRLASSLERLNYIRNGEATKSGYLKERDEEISEEEEDLLENRIDRYDTLLSSSLSSFFFRIGYPVKL